MDNILLVFLNDLENIQEFNAIIDKFSEKKYSMYLLDSIKEDEYFNMDSLPELVEFYKSQHESINKFVVLSNSRDLLFSWYRCYNSVVDDFIYFVDENEKNYFNIDHRHFGFYDKLSLFNQINQESLNGKIYLNIHFNNYKKIIKFLLGDNDFRYFDSFDNYNFDEREIEKENISKKYIADGYEYLFGADNKNTQEINLSMAQKASLEDNNNFIKYIFKSSFLIPYITALFYKDKNQEKTNLLLYIYRKLKEVDKEFQKEIFNQMYQYINNSNINYKEKIYISSLLVMINLGDERLTEFMMRTLLEDEEYMEYHYDIIANVLFYQGNEHLTKHSDYYLNLRNSISKLAKWVSKDLQIEDYRGVQDNKKIAIIVDQLMSLNHSPTKLMLDYARNIKKYYPEYSVEIFVEDNLYCNNKLGILPYLYTSAISKSMQEEHNNYLNEESIQINYANVSLNKKDRTIDLAKKVVEFNPDTILTNSDISLINRIFYNKYPIVYMSMGGDYFSNLADAYLCISREKVLEENYKHDLLDVENVHEFKYGLEFLDAKKVVNKSDYGIEKYDFVMVTVGNRLDAELDEEFIDKVAKFMSSNINTKWLIVGPKTIEYIEEKYTKLLNNQILKIKYEDDLPALYKICDVYLSPRRKGGGISIAMAMNEGLPIIITKDSTDGVSYVGKDYAVNDMNEYIVYLDKLMKEDDYMQAVSKEMVQRIRKYNMRSSIEKIMNILYMEDRI